VPAAIRLDFDASTTVFGTAIRLDTLALAGVIFLMLVLMALRAGRASESAGPDGTDDLRRLRRDDLILIAFGAVPGAAIGGRIGYVLLHLDYYRADPAIIFDPFRGGMELTLAVLLGSLTAVSVARLLAAPIGRWLAVAAVPLLIGLGLGKLTMVLGGAGQGLFSNASYATAYVRPGPWGSANADLAAVPSQVLEGALVLALVVAVIVVPFLLRLRLTRWLRVVRPALAPRRNWPMLTGGRRFLTLLGLWAVARFAAVFTWRDAHILGPLAAEQLILMGLMVLAFVGPLVVWGARRARVGIPAWRIARRERRARAAETKAAIAAEAAELARLTAAAKAVEDAKAAEEARVAAEAARVAEEAAAAAQEAQEAEEAEKIIQSKGDLQAQAG